MRWFDRIFTRGSHAACFREMPWRSHRRLINTCRELSVEEGLVQRQMRLSVTPRLLLVDEEQAAILTPEQRRERDDGDDGSG